MRMMKPSSAQSRFSRRGILCIELVLALPMLAIVLFGLFEFSLLFFARGSVVDAARAGARHATLPGVRIDDVKREVRRTLNHQLRDSAQIQVRTGKHPGDPVEVAVLVPMRSASPDLLWPVGYSLQGRYLFSRTRMIRE